MSLTESEEQAFDLVTRSSGFDPWDFELTTLGSGAYAAHAFVNVRRRSNGFQMTYATGRKSWLFAFKDDLRAGVFGRGAGSSRLSVH